MRRGNSINKQLLPTKQLEQETRVMEERIVQLKQFMMTQRQGVDEPRSAQSGSRWQAASSSKPIRNYATNVLKNKRQSSANKSGSRNPLEVKSMRDTKMDLSMDVTMRRTSGIILPKIIKQQTNENLDRSRPPSSSSSIKKSLSISQVSAQSQGEVSVQETPKTVDIKVEKPKKNGIALSNMIKSQQPNKKPRGGTLQQNLSRALLAQKELSNDVVQFMQRIGLQHYAGLLLESGFDDLDTLQEIEIYHLQQMKIPPRDGRQLLIQNEPNNKNSSSTIYEKKQVIENSLLNGSFDEQESHQSFLEALYAFRGVKSIDENQKTKKLEQSKKSVRFDETSDLNNNPQKKGILKKPQSNEKNSQGVEYFSSKISKKFEDEQKQFNDIKKSFFFLGSDPIWSNNDYPFDIENGAQTEQQQTPQAKESCWTCLKLIYRKSGIQVREKWFCQQRCQDSYEKEQIVILEFILNKIQCICKAYSCSKVLDKEKVYYQHGLLFCNQDCFGQFKWENEKIQKISSRSIKPTQQKQQLYFEEPLSEIELTLD